MRVGIDYRILSVGPALVTRGMGRYTQQQLRAVLDADDRNEYVLLANRGNDLSLIVPEVLEAENTSIEVYSPPRLEQPPGLPFGSHLRWSRSAPEPCLDRC